MYESCDTKKVIPGYCLPGTVGNLVQAGREQQTYFCGSLVHWWLLSVCKPQSDSLEAKSSKIQLGEEVLHVKCEAHG